MKPADTISKRKLAQAAKRAAPLLIIFTLAIPSLSFARDFVRIPSIYSQHWNQAKWWEPPQIPGGGDSTIIPCCGGEAGCAQVQISSPTSVDALRLLRSSIPITQHSNPENTMFPRACSGEPPRALAQPLISVGGSISSTLRVVGGEPVVAQGGIISVSRSNTNAVNNLPDLYVKRLELKAMNASGQEYSGELRMKGGFAKINRSPNEWARNGIIDVDKASKITGHGKILFNGGSGSVLNLNGDLVPSCGELILDANTEATLDLDGSNERGSIIIDKSDCGLNNRLPANLVINGELTDAFNGRLTIGTYSSALFYHPWTNSGDLIFQADNNTPATLKGRKIIHKGKVAKLAVKSGIGRIESAVEFHKYATVEVARGSRLELSGPTVYRGGYFHGEGKIVQNGAATIADKTLIKVRTYDWDRNGSNQTTILPGATFTIASESLGGPYPPDPSRWPTNLYMGTLDINGGILRIQTADPEWYMLGQMTLAPGDRNSTARVESGHLHIGGYPGWSGPANYSAKLKLKGDAEIKGDLSIGLGDIRFDFNDIDRGQLNVNGKYFQHEKSVLHIRLAGTEDGHYDKIQITDTATVAGKLDVRLDRSFDINIGDKFPILTAREVRGTMVVEPEWVKRGDGRYVHLVLEQTRNQLVLIADTIK